MKKIIQPEISEVVCDFTGKKITQKDYLGGRLSLDLLFFKKEMERVLKSEGFSGEELKDAINSDAYEDYNLHFDMNEDVAIDLYKYLLRKYPRQVKKILSEVSCYERYVNNLKVVKSNWR